MKGRNGPTAFVPLSPKIGGLINDNKPSIGQNFTREQVNFVYKKTKSQVRRLIQKHYSKN